MSNTMLIRVSVVKVCIQYNYVPNTELTHVSANNIMYQSHTTNTVLATLMVP